MHVICKNIEWETDGEDRKKCGLPEFVVFLDVDEFDDEEELSEKLGDRLSDEFGFLHQGFEYESDFTQFLTSGMSAIICF